MRLSKNSKVEAIKRAPLFSQCSKRDLEEIARIADEIDLREGKEMTREGAPGREFFVLLEGTADVRRKNRKVASMKAGDFFGEIALVSRKPRTATVVATSPVHALVVTEQSFRGLMAHQPQIQLKVLQALAARVAGDSL
jgi:CRP-like cAMP-binding protein